jgi:putative membrane protein
MRRRKWIALVAVLVVLGAAAVVAKNRLSSSENFTDAQFAAKAAQGGLAEVEMGRLAAQKGGSEAVRSFGQRMASDHTAAAEQLQKTAAQENINLPNDLDQDAKQTYDKLAKLSGPAFDRAYARDMVKDHKKDVAEFQKEASAGKDEGIRTFAANTLPTLQDHLKAARDMDDTLLEKTIPTLPK